MSSNSIDLPWEIFPPTTGGVLPDTDPGGGGTGRPGVRCIHQSMNLITSPNRFYSPAAVDGFFIVFSNIVIIFVCLYSLAQSSADLLSYMIFHQTTTTTIATIRSSVVRMVWYAAEYATHSLTHLIPYGSYQHHVEPVTQRSLV